VGSTNDSSRNGQFRKNQPADVLQRALFARRRRDSDARLARVSGSLLIPLRRADTIKTTGA